MLLCWNTPASKREEEEGVFYSEVPVLEDPKRQTKSLNQIYSFLDFESICKWFRICFKNLNLKRFPHPLTAKSNIFFKHSLLKYVSLCNRFAYRLIVDFFFTFPLQRWNRMKREILVRLTGQLKMNLLSDGSSCEREWKEKTKWMKQNKTNPQRILNDLF